MFKDYIVSESPEPGIQPAPMILPCQLPTWEYIKPLLAKLVTLTSLKHVPGTVESVPDNSGTSFQDRPGTQDRSGTQNLSETLQTENEKLLKDVPKGFDNIPEVLEKIVVLADDSQGFLEPRLLHFILLKGFLEPRLLYFILLKGFLEPRLLYFILLKESLVIQLLETKIKIIFVCAIAIILTAK